jgi:uncharacterized membrane protein
MEHHVTAVVAAPPEAVWNLFIDVERWPRMTESISRVRRVDGGPLRVGSEAVVEQPRLPRARWRVTQMEPGRSFTWETTAPGVTTVGGHVVEAGPQGSVVTLTLQVRGALARPVYALVRGRSRRYLSMEAEGFRRAAEARG